MVAVISFALGFSVLARNVKNKLFIAFALLSSLVSVWALSFFLSKILEEEWIYRVHLFTNILIAPIGLGFIRVLIRVEDAMSRSILTLAIIAAVVETVALIFHWDSIYWVKQILYFSPALIMLQAFHLMWIDRRLRRGFKRLPKMPTVGFARRNFIYWGGMFVLAASCMDHVPWLGEIVPSIGNIGLAIYLFFLSQAITQQRLLNFSALLSRFFVLLTVALTLTALYSLLVVWVQNSPGLFFLNSFIASFLILMLLDPLRALVRYFTHRLLTKEHLRLELVLREGQLKLAGVIDPATLGDAIFQILDQTLAPEWAALFVLRPDGTRFRCIRTSGEEPKRDQGGLAQPTLREVLASHPLLEYSERLRRRGDLPILLDQIIENEIDRSASRTQQEHLAGLIQGLKALGSNLLIPLSDREKTLAFLALKVNAPPEPWGNNWGFLPILYPYFELAARTMRNMEVFVKQRELERLATVGEMAAGLAHEIRNPLGAIKGAAQYLDPTADRPESKFLRVIVEEVDRLNHVVTQFLDYSKPTTTDLKELDLAELAKKTVEVMRSGIEDSVLLEFIDSKVPAPVKASPEQIQQVLVNLIQNSQKALQGRKYPKIRVSVESESPGQSGEVIVTVEDNGCGIRKEHLDKLFIPFFTTSPSGTGLGLSISHKIIEAHQGRIEVASEEGRFTKFTVVLPYSRGT